MKWLIDLTAELQVSLLHACDSVVFKKACQNDFLNFKQIKMSMQSNTSVHLKTINVR